MIEKETQSQRNARIRSPLAGWVGGKFLLAKRIVAKIPEEHQCYCEVFAGAGWVLFRKPPSATEVLNDKNQDVATLYRVIQHHFDEFARQFEWILTSRTEFARLSSIPGESLTDIQRAARFFYLQHTAFAGRIKGRQTFCYSVVQPPKLHLPTLRAELESVHNRLSEVYIECLSYDDILQRYDRPGTVFYLDPPYDGCEDYYGKGLWTHADFGNLAKILANIKGRFILSINNTSEMRETFGRFQIGEVETRYTLCATGNNLRTKELLITNF